MIVSSTSCVHSASANKPTPPTSSMSWRLGAFHTHTSPRIVSHMFSLSRHLSVTISHTQTGRPPELSDQHREGGSVHFAHEVFSRDEPERFNLFDNSSRRRDRTLSQDSLFLFLSIFKAPLIVHETSLNYSKTNTSEHKGVKCGVKFKHQALIYVCKKIKGKTEKAAA